MGNKRILNGTVWDLEDLPTYEELWNENRENTAKLSKHEKDLADAAGELLIDIPAPGTDTAKLLHANRMLHYERERLQKKLFHIQQILNKEQ